MQVSFCKENPHVREAPLNVFGYLVPLTFVLDPYKETLDELVRCYYTEKTGSESRTAV